MLIEKQVVDLVNQLEPLGCFGRFAVLVTQLVNSLIPQSGVVVVVVFAGQFRTPVGFRIWVERAAPTLRGKLKSPVPVSRLKAAGAGQLLQMNLNPSVQLISLPVIRSLLGTISSRRFQSRTVVARMRI